jgi:hypothetical protein
MPFLYDLNRVTTTNASGGTETTHMRAATIANQETVNISGLYATARAATAGGATLRAKHNTGTAASGGTAQTPAPKNLRGNPAAQSTWFNDATAITAGGTLVQRISVGFAQTGGMGGYVPTLQNGAVQMMPNTTNPVDLEITSIASAGAIPFDFTVDIGEGI